MSGFYGEPYQFTADARSPFGFEVSFDAAAVELEAGKLATAEILL